MTTKNPSRDAYKAFVRERIEVDRLAFHPDTPFSEYVHLGRDGARVYTPEAAADLQADHDLLLGDFDQYAVSIEVMQQLGYLRGATAADANTYARRRVQRNGGERPVILSEDSPDADLAAWLRWYDPNAGYAEVERTSAELWGFVGEAVTP